MNTLWYFPLEIVKSRYTQQLCEKWMPDAFKGIDQDRYQLMGISGHQPYGTEIAVGQVLDATGRGYFALTQCANFLAEIRAGRVRDGDVLYFQDFWTPGIDAIFYALNLYRINVRAYAMCHAQSVDEYDFTYNMLPWIRNYELGIDSVLSGIFVASSIHKDQLVRAGFKAPIHVVGLPIDMNDVRNAVPRNVKQRAVVFSSRLDKEKNPMFMMAVASELLKKDPDLEWWVTTSSAKLSSNDPAVIPALERMQSAQPRFKVFTGISKEDYYNFLSLAQVQFNCSKQDYVSWTLLEAAAHDCALVYPYFRSFPECLEGIPMYDAFAVYSAVNHIENALFSPQHYITKRPLILSHIGRKETAHEVLFPSGVNINVWKY